MPSKKEQMIKKHGPYLPPDASCWIQLTSGFRGRDNRPTAKHGPKNKFVAKVGGRNAKIEMAVYFTMKPSQRSPVRFPLETKPKRNRPFRGSLFEDLRGAYEASGENLSFLDRTAAKSPQHGLIRTPRAAETLQFNTLVAPSFGT